MATTNLQQRPREQTGGECPECDGAAITDGTETVCDSCGLILDEDAIDRAGGVNDFIDDPENTERTGAPLTETKHDRGLDTRIGFRRDGKGNTLSSEQREKFSRLRTQHKRAQLGPSRDRALGQAFGEIKRMASALGLSKAIVEQACRLFRSAQAADELRGRAIEAVAGACLYATARINEQPLLTKDVGHVARVEQIAIERAHRKLNRELGLPTPPPDPIDYVPRVASDVDAPDEVRRLAEAIVAAWKDANPGAAGCPGGVAAGAVYTAAREAWETNSLTQPEAAEAVGTSHMTVRTRYHEMEDLEVDDDRR